jgi:hypothetical protein
LAVRLPIVRKVSTPQATPNGSRSVTLTIGASSYAGPGQFVEDRKNRLRRERSRRISGPASLTTITKLASVTRWMRSGAAGCDAEGYLGDSLRQATGHEPKPRQDILGDLQLALYGRYLLGLSIFVDVAAG